jgi:serine phosphatase RsbU (regulator of sigma subunit)
LYTDGVTEAFNASRQEFGEERLSDLILHHRDGSADEALTALKEALHAHIGETLQSDDITALVVKCV